MRGRPPCNFISGATLHRGDAPEKMDEFWEFCPAKSGVREFAQPLIDGMVAHLPEIDERIARYCENYDFSRISPVDREVLRLGDLRNAFIATTSRRSFRLTKRSSWRKHLADRIPDVS